MGRETWEDLARILLGVLQAQPGQELCASELAEITGIKKGFVRRALTENADQQTPLAGVAMAFKLKPGGRLKRPGHWFSWVGHSTLVMIAGTPLCAPGA